MLRKMLLGLAAIALVSLPPTHTDAKPPQGAASRFVEADSWQETLRQSREAMASYFEKEAEHKQPDGNVPSGVTLGPWHAIGPFDVPPGAEGLNYELPIERESDLTKKYGELSWRRFPNPDGVVYRDIDLPDHHVMYLTRTITAAKRATITGYFGSDDGSVVWLNGQQLFSTTAVRLPPKATALQLKLDAGENRLLVKVHNITGGKAYYFSTEKATNQGKRRDDPVTLAWKLTEKSFKDSISRLQMTWEREDRIWQADWKPGAFRDLAGRYAEATRKTSMLDVQARRLAARASNAEELDQVRKIYYRSRTMELAVARARETDFSPLRRAIEDLSKTYDTRYPHARRFLDRLAKLEAQRESATDTETLLQLVEQYTALQQEALLANPLLDFEKLLLVRRRGHLGMPQNWQGNCALPRAAFDDEIAVLSPVRPDGSVTTVYRPEEGLFVGDVDLNFDARRMLFSMRDNNGRFQIYEIDTDGKDLRQVTKSEPDVDNYDACYLPDGQIVFASTACFQGVPCVGGGNQVANLYRMNADGEAVRQLCFDQDHDWCPTVANDGRVMFTRWEYSDTPHYFTRVLMHMNPDGTGQTALYGSNSFWPNSTFFARPIPGHPSRFVAVISGHHGAARMGELILFDPAVGTQEADGAIQRIPGYGKKVEPIIQDQLVNNSWPKFLHPYPLSDKHFIVSAQIDAASPWNLYLVDVFDNMVLLFEDSGYAAREPIPLREKSKPPVIPERVDLTRKDGVVYLSDIYTGGGLKGIPRGTVKSLRVFAFDYGYQRLANHTYIGIEGPWDVHRILGTVPVEHDGSAMFRIPSNTPVSVQPLDEDGKALQIMRSWFVAMPGERISCVGCHESNRSTPPLHYSLALKKPIEEIRPWFGPARGFSFKREVQPVLDQHCVGCHNDKPYEGSQLSDLRAGMVDKFSRAYTHLQRYVRRPGPESDYHMMPPAEYHADTSPLVQMLAKGHYGVELDRESWERIYTWIDLNVPDHGTWHEFREIPNKQRARRYELRQKYAGIDIDYEDIPTLPIKVVKPIIPKWVPPARPRAKIDCPGWPFDTAMAKRRQGPDPTRTFTLGDDRENPIPLTLMRIPAGEFVMGAARDGRAEQPCRVPIKKSFWIGAAEITNEQYHQFDPTHDSRYIDRPGKDHSNRGVPQNQPNQPVVRVSWERAMAFCRWLSNKTDKKFSLPTEAQWEYACRAGSAENVQGSNTWGAANMLGGVEEWTRTTYRPYPYRGDDGRDDVSSVGRKVVRGSRLLNMTDDRRVTFRLDYYPWSGIHNVGFRVVCESKLPAIETRAK